MRQVAHLLLVGFMLCTVLARAEDGSAPAGSDQAALKSMREEIVKLIGEPRCVNGFPLPATDLESPQRRSCLRYGFGLMI